MSELEARFRVRLEGGDELSNFFKRTTAEATQMHRVLGGALRDTTKQIAGFAASTAKSLASLAIGNIGIAAQAKSVLAFRDSVSALAVMADKGEESLAGLRDEIHAVAKASNQMQDDVTASLAAFVEKTGNLNAARANLGLYGKVALATGAAMKDVALVGAELDDKMKIKGASKQGEAFSILTAQSKTGAVELRDLATKAPKMFSSVAGFFGVAKDPLETLRGTGALAQVYAKAYGGTGTSASIATSMQNTFADIIKNRARVEKLTGHKLGTDPYQIIKDIIIASGGNTEQLLKNGRLGVFNIQAQRGINIMAEEYRRTGRFDTYDKFRNVKGADLDVDAAQRRNTGQASLKASLIAIASSADKNLGESFDRLAKHAHYLSDAFDFATRNVALTISAITAGMLGKNIGGAMLSRMMVQQVYVTGAAPGVLGGGAGGAAAFGTKAAQVFGALAAFGIGFEVGRILDAKFGISTKAAKVAGAITGQNTTDVLEADDKGRYAARDRNRGAYGERNARIKYYEGQGMDHGAAIAAADAIAKAIRDMTVTHNVTINGDSAKGETEGGTRSPDIRVRRGQMQYVNGGG